MTSQSAQSAEPFNDLQAAIRSRFAMGTVVTHKAFGLLAEQAVMAAERETQRLEAMMSRFIQKSEISKLNAYAGAQTVAVSMETMKVLNAAKEYSALCDGRFDVTVGPLVDLWGRGKKALKPPREADLKGAVSLVDYTGIKLDSKCQTAGLLKEGQSVDLGGIAKGYAADQVLESMRKFGIGSAFTDFGGNVATIGSKPDGTPWHVGIRHPRQENALIGALSVVGKSVVTSADDQRYFVGRDGQRHHHILDPKSGFPADSGIISATVVSNCSMQADALSTILFVVGLEKGLAILQAFPAAEAVLMDKERRVFITEGLLDCFEAAEGMNVQFV